MRPTSFAGLLVAGCLLALSCRGAGPGQYHVSGSITFDGKPVPAGRIYFHPSIPRGNAGPPALAEIHNGIYDTRKGGSAGPGGPVGVAIEGYDGKPNATDPRGQSLFPAYYVELELPRAHAVKDFDVPASAATSRPPSPEPAP